MGGEGGVFGPPRISDPRTAYHTEDDGPGVPLFAVHGDNDNSSVSDDDDIVAILDEEVFFWTGYFNMGLSYLLSLQCTTNCPLIVAVLHWIAKFRHIRHNWCFQYWISHFCIETRNFACVCFFLCFKPAR